MSESSSGRKSAFAGVHGEVLSDTSGEVFAVNLGRQAAEQLIEVLDKLEKPPAVRMLTYESVLKWLLDDFLTASAMADEAAVGELSLRVSETPKMNSLLLTETAAVPLVSPGEQVAAPVIDDNRFVENAHESLEDTWDEATEFRIRTPPRTQVYDSFKTEIGDEAWDDFKTMLTSLDNTRGDGLNVVVVSLLAAAKHEVQFYDISTWGEDVGVASRATFSRVKTALEESGLIDTEKVPIDVGRPRLRLVLGDERLQGADNGEIISIAQNMLFGTGV